MTPTTVEVDTPVKTDHPHQLRHSMASQVRAKYKMEAARVFMGHSDMKVTEIYAERDLALLRKIAREIG